MDVTTGDHGVGWLGGSCRWWCCSASPRRPRPIMTAVLLFIGTPPVHPRSCAHAVASRGRSDGDDGAKSRGTSPG